MIKRHEKTFNEKFAETLRTFRPEWNSDNRVLAEASGVFIENSALQPDILIRHPEGVPIVIESKFESKEKVQTDAKNRLGLNLVKYDKPIEQSIALNIPKKFKSIDDNFDDSALKKEILNTTFDFCFFSLKGDETKSDCRWPVHGWITGKIDYLVDLIELTAFSENALVNSLGSINTSIMNATADLRRNYAKKQDTLNRIANSLHQKDSELTTSMAMAIVFNAILFHKSLIGFKGVKSFEDIWEPLDKNIYKKLQLLHHWQEIVTNINYYSIFKIAMEILKPIDESKNIIKILYNEAEEVKNLGITSRHDTCGRTFQQLISHKDRKRLSAFHTLDSSSALLAEFAIHRLNVDLSNPKEIKSLKVGDFACGTGTLLHSAVRSILREFKKSGGNAEEIHKHIVNNTIVGIDILPTASHLTLSKIAGEFPNNKIERKSIITAPFGESSEFNGSNNVFLGSLELLGSDNVIIDSNCGTDKNTKTNNNVQDLVDGSFDMIIMNPPYSRSTGHEAEKLGVPIPAFSALETDETIQRLMSKKLEKLKTTDMVGHGNAGLASNFFDIVHKKIKLNGVIALILPLTFLQGNSWEKMRERLEKNYSDIVIFSIASIGQTGHELSDKDLSNSVRKKNADEKSRAFSSDTGMAEILLIANRSDNNENSQIKYINLVKRPETIREAVLIAKKAIDEPEASDISIGDLTVAYKFDGNFSSSGFAGVIYDGPALSAKKLFENKLKLPRLQKEIKLRMVNLGKLIEREGKYPLDIIGESKNKAGEFRGPFDKKEHSYQKVLSYPMLWTHDAKRETKLIVEPDSLGTPRKGHDPKADKIWDETKSKLHFNRDFRLNSQPLAACYTESDTIGGHAWPNVVLSESEWDIPILLWANTTLGLISYWWQGTRQQLGRVRLSKTILPNLCVLNVFDLSSDQFSQAQEIFDTIKVQEFLPANEAYHDETRKSLDKMVFVEMLGQPSQIIEENLGLLRLQWCDEPSVHGWKKTAPKKRDFNSV